MRLNKASVNINFFLNTRLEKSTISPSPQIAFLLMSTLDYIIFFQNNLCEFFFPIIEKFI